MNIILVLLIVTIFGLTALKKNRNSKLRSNSAKLGWIKRKKYAGVIWSGQV